VKSSFAFCVLLSSSAVFAQGKYGLSPTTYARYQASVRANPDNALVDLKKFIPGIVLDIRYATTDNFTHARVYSKAMAYARKPVAEALRKAQADFNAVGYGIKIYDGYRPYSATVRFYELMKGDTTYVASPYKGSRHNRGCALDMTIVDLKTGKELAMPSPYDAMQKESWPSTPVSDSGIRKNRDLLISTMEKNGFKVYATEWWHFDFTGWDKFDVLDIPFEQLALH
jgi:D-alanyl-D-alanine dipeptidase